MEKSNGNKATQIFWSIVSFLRRCLFLVISVRPIPHHIAFIMDGNRRYAKKRKLKEGDGHRVGDPEEVQSLMDLIQEKIEGLIKEESIVNRYGIKRLGFRHFAWAILTFQRSYFYLDRKRKQS
ncbi:hypothetical protein L3X38_001319 [Prunus dulcis]|uniref:Ditrans,polycis-polyprenyl diphosphate synthase ((2E,6E)-farnesyl diphosphate specific) n=1 Tax=Prunus dulcis TaxID=3755 RepID=A0AAD4WTU3_PRUDU|nr:hypothetical protein L3X38_001319 [Prunus dulcis]